MTTFQPTNPSTTKMLVWYRIVDSAGILSSATKAEAHASADIDDFRKEVKKDNPNSLADVDVSTLLVYKSQAAYDSNEGPLDEETLVGDYGSSKKVALVVVRSSNVPTIGEVLSLTLPPALVSETPTSFTTNHSVYTRDPIKVNLWSTLDSEVRAFIQSIDTKKRVKAPFMEQDGVPIFSETNVNDFVLINVVTFLRKLDGNFSHFSPYSSRDFLGRPDFGIVDNSNGDRLILVFELKCPWVIGYDVDLLNSKNAESKHIIAQLNGYMYLNNISYCILSTYNHWWFFKRVTENDLLISSCYPCDSSRPTVLECVYYMIALGKASPQRLPITTREVKVILENGDNKLVQFEERLSKGNYSDVWRITLLPEGRQGVFKMVDVKCGRENAKSFINTEIEIYKKLQSLQGLYIPKFEDVGRIGDILYGFITSYDGKAIQEKLNMVEKEELKFIVGELHKLGVAHGDLRFPNVVRNNAGRLTLIDFGSAGECTDVGMAIWKDWRICVNRDSFSHQ